MLAIVVVAVADTTTKRAIKAPVDFSVPAQRDSDAARLREVAREPKPAMAVDCGKTSEPRDERCVYGKNGPLMPVLRQIPAEAQSGRRPVVENPPVRLNQ